MDERRKKPSGNSQSDTLAELLSDVMENLIEANRSNSQSVSEMKPLVHDTKEIALEILRKFQNGFRQEMKNHISLEVKTQADTIRASIAELSKQLDEQKKIIEANGVEIRYFRNTIRKPQFWIKLITALMLAIAALVTTINTTCNHPLIKGQPTTQTASLD